MEVGSKTDLFQDFSVLFQDTPGVILLEWAALSNLGHIVAIGGSICCDELLSRCSVHGEARRDEVGPGALIGQPCGLDECSTRTLTSGRQYPYTLGICQ